jgi:hypothetical protein
MQFQHQLGNQTAQRLQQTNRLQAKLTIDKSNDNYEREAGWVADQMMRMPDPNIIVQSMANEQNSPLKIQQLCHECEDKLRRQPIDEIEEEG